MINERDRWWHQFSQWGRVEVERRLRPESADKFSDPVNLYAAQWLDKLDQDAERRREVAQSEQMELQRRAATAAEVAASAALTSAEEARKANNHAKTANRIAAAAAVAAAVAMIISIIALTLKGG